MFCMINGRKAGTKEEFVLFGRARIAVKNECCLGGPQKRSGDLCGVFMCGIENGVVDVYAAIWQTE